jgi:hypothetical protein
MKSILWRVAVRLSYIQDAWCLKVNTMLTEVPEYHRNGADTNKIVYTKVHAHN